MKITTKSLPLLLAATFLSTGAYASDTLENNLLSTLKIKLNEYGDIERNANYGQAIRAYMNKGYIRVKLVSYLFLTTNLTTLTYCYVSSDLNIELVLYYFN